MKFKIFSIIIFSTFLVPTATQKRLPWYFHSSARPPMTSQPTYLGVMKVPSGGCGTDFCNSNYSQGVMGIDEAGNGGLGSMYYATRVYDSGSNTFTKVAEISLENDLAGGASLNPATTTLASAPAAKLLQNWADPLVGTGLNDGADWMGGISVVTYQGTSRLLIKMFGSFGSVSSGKTHYIASKNLSSPAVIVPAFVVNPTGGNPATCANSTTCPDGWVGQGSEFIPAEYQSDLGGDIMSGQCCSSIIGRTSFGGTTSVWTLADAATAPVTAVRLWGYPITHPTLGGYPNLGDVGGLRLFSVQNDWNRIVWPEGYSTILDYRVLGDPLGSCYCDNVAGDTDGDPVTESIGTNHTRITGSNASSDATGTVITMPNKDLSGVSLQTNTADGFFWFPDQTGTINTIVNRHYADTAQIIAKANSGTPTANVTLSQAVTPNLTNQNYIIGLLAAYDPPNHGDNGTPNTPKGDHGPHAYPYEGRIYRYSVDDAIAVKNGSMNFYDNVPYDSSWTFDTPLTHAGGKYKSFYIGGVAHSHTNHRIYISNLFKDSAGAAGILVFGYTAGVPVPTPLGYGYLSLWFLVVVGRKVL